MKYRIYFDAEEVINGIKDFDTIKELLDFIAKMSWNINWNTLESLIEESESFKIHYISEIEEKIITLEEPIRIAKEIGKKEAIEEAKDLDLSNKQYLEDMERTRFEELKKKFEGS